VPSDELVREPDWRRGEIEDSRESLGEMSVELDAESLTRRREVGRAEPPPQEDPPPEPEGALAAHHFDPFAPEVSIDAFVTSYPRIPREWLEDVALLARWIAVAACGKVGVTLGPDSLPAGVVADLTDAGAVRVSMVLPGCSLGIQVVVQGEGGLLSEIHVGVEFEAALTHEDEALPAHLSGYKARKTDGGCVYELVYERSGDLGDSATGALAHDTLDQLREFAEDSARFALVLGLR